MSIFTGQAHKGLFSFIVNFSAEEAGRYLETYKVYENKPPDALQSRSDGDYLTKVWAMYNE